MGSGSSAPSTSAAGSGAAGAGAASTASAGFSSGSSGLAPGITLGTNLGAVSPDGTFGRGGNPAGTPGAGAGACCGAGA
ncbi:MAG: hypothetical protein ACKOTD_09515, partial [Phycisphaerales bacterium]